MSNDLSVSTHAAVDCNNALNELRTRARVRLNALERSEPEATEYARWIGRKRRWSIPAQWKLQHALNIVASELGFQDWEHARRVLEGRARSGEHMGGLWYDFRCQLLLNHWFADYAAARLFRERRPQYWLFPYAKQFVLGDAEYVRTLGLDPDSQLAADVDRDLVASYASAAWRTLCAARLAATRARPLLPRHF